MVPAIGIPELPLACDVHPLIWLFWTLQNMPEEHSHNAIYLIEFGIYIKQSRSMFFVPPKFPKKNAL